MATRKRRRVRRNVGGSTWSGAKGMHTFKIGSDTVNLFGWYPPHGFEIYRPGKLGLSGGLFWDKIPGGVNRYELRDFDGGYFLPRKVGDALRSLGLVVDPELFHQ